MYITKLAWDDIHWQTLLNYKNCATHKGSCLAVVLFLLLLCYVFEIINKKSSTFSTRFSIKPRLKSKPSDNRTGLHFPCLCNGNVLATSQDHCKNETR